MCECHVQSLGVSENNIQVVSTLWVYDVLNLVGHTSRVSHSSQGVTPICSACSHYRDRVKFRMHTFTLTTEYTVWVCVHAYQGEVTLIYTLLQQLSDLDCQCLIWNVRHTVFGCVYQIVVNGQDMDFKWLVDGQSTPNIDSKCHIN